jgi:predicted ribonuclease YlaK
MENVNSNTISDLELTEKIKAVVDTNALMDSDCSGFLKQFIENGNELIVPLVVVQELDKHAHCADERRKFQARLGLKFIRENKNKLTFDMENDVYPGLNNSTNDGLIISVAIRKKSKLITLDMAMQLIAEQFNIDSLEIKVDTTTVTNYSGYKEIELTDGQWALIAINGLTENLWDLKINEYALFTSNGCVKDAMRWTKEGFVKLTFKELNSSYLDKVKPKDIYQRCAIHSLENDAITVLCGEAGTAKTLFSLAYLMEQLDKKTISKIYIVHNPVGMYGAKEIGFRSGDTLEKLMQSSIGGVLSSKLGDGLVVEQLIAKNKLVLLPVSDIRGLQIEKGCALYITEAQNMTSYLLKTAIQRCADGSKIIIDGDIESQVDGEIFKYDSGVKRAIDVFTKAECDSFGVVKMVNNYRGKLSAIAELM